MREIIKNASYLFFGNFTVRLLLAIATIFFARYTGATEYGRLSVALAFTAIITFFTDAGLSQTFLREGSKKEVNIGKLLSSYLRARLVLTICVTIITFILVETFYHDAQLKKIIYWMAIPTIFGATFQGIGIVYFQSIEKMKFTAIIQILQGLGNSSALLLGMLFEYSLVKISIIYGFSSILVGGVAAFLVFKKIRIDFSWDKGILDDLVIFTLNGVILMIIPQLGPIILEKLMSLDNVGYFSTAFKIPSVLYQIPGVIAIAFYPKLFAFGINGEVDKHRELSQVELKIMSFLGVVAALPFIVNPEFWIVSLLGEKWVASSPALSILSFLVIFRAINFPLADYLTTKGNQMKRTFTMCLGLVVAIICYIILGAKYGLIGGAIAPIITEVVLLIGFCSFIPKGLSFLFKGISYNLLGAIISTSLYAIFLKDFYPIVGFIVMEIIFIILIGFFDKQIYLQLKKNLKRKKKNINIYDI